MSDNDQQAIEDAVEQIGLSMASNAFPLFYVAQNVYDTSESVWTVWNSRDSTDEMVKVEAGIDLVFAVVGWVPVVGAGVKRTFRLVNHKSDIYGPLLFDILRLVLQRAGVHTSPEELVDKLFDASGLKTVLTGAREHIEKSWLFREMPVAAQATFRQALVWVETNLPYWLTQFLERKLLHWKKKQPNSSAQTTLERRKETDKPGKVGVEAEEGHNRPSASSSPGVVNAKLAVADITNGVTGVLGEHIADYYCYETLGWGKGWEAHDQGLLGKWSHEPGADVPGKLNDHGKLNKLFDLRPRGHGIDGVWRANPGTNEGKPFAIVEAKSSKVDKPMKDPEGKRNMSPKLGLASRIKDAVRPSADELLEPPADDQQTAAVSPPAGGKPGGGRNRPRTQAPPPDVLEGKAEPKKSTGKMVQMSHQWIETNLSKAVLETVAAKILIEGYSRHILYVPFYLPAAVEHEAALLKGDEHSHSDHGVPSTHHYRDAEVQAAVEKKQRKLLRQSV
ncbi:hypothetical protein [Paraburkholderia terricola]|uniref:Uncharacterized protein n=1 Tax=Paraburkholderia terricola TaxID=169427 RepID=A0A1M6P923_9BURK|nr:MULTISPECIES: hypothetical protein [Paraburkholderia]SDO29000.1 hypothetical protein SAMN05192547_101351 [Paraburkholderia sediminicola]SHK04433.1 hypothetical protein SAMN05192548_101251 [Paraburkholderia terricola]